MPIMVRSRELTSSLCGYIKVSMMDHIFSGEGFHQ